MEGAARGKFIGMEIVIGKEILMLVVIGGEKGEEGVQEGGKRNKKKKEGHVSLECL